LGGDSVTAVKQFGLARLHSKKIRYELEIPTGIPLVYELVKYNMKSPVKVAVTGAGVRIGYSLL
jgi:hypothetical protein